MARGEARRQLREQIAFEMNTMNANADDWMQIEPHLDDAMHALDDTDRIAILLRYFENKSLREVGQTLGTTDDTARKRVNRAVERLREFFAKRGITIGGSGLVVVISANAIQAAPVGLAVTISTATALAGTASATTTATATKIIAMTTVQKTLITVTLVAAVAMGIYEAHQAATLRSQFQQVQQQTEQLQRERDEVTARLAALQKTSERLNLNTGELAKLRGDLARGRNEANAFAKEAKDAKDFQAGVMQIFSNTPPIRTFLLTALTTASWDQAILTGGWKTPSGKRAMLLVTLQPGPGDDGRQLTIRSKVLEYTEEASKTLGLAQFSTDGNTAVKAHILNYDELEAILRGAKNYEGVEILASPTVTTESGRHAEVQTVDMHQTPSGEKYSTGPVIEFIPTISPDGQSVQMVIAARLDYLIEPLRQLLFNQ